MHLKIVSVISEQNQAHVEKFIEDFKRIAVTTCILKIKMDHNIPLEREIPENSLIRIAAEKEVEQVLDDLRDKLSLCLDYIYRIDSFSKHLATLNKDERPDTSRVERFFADLEKLKEEIPPKGASREMFLLFIKKVNPLVAAHL